ncbi:lipopolysaccharide biosynthesis protein [Paenirhodobacter sp.]|uniref:lipopolysaccharide biosynthesis protein n=1 Tax=Paenirhodobacter sp. TaxID=1965326 RepID=UPI003B400E81
MLTMRTMRGAAWLVLSRFVGRLIDFVTLIVLARILTPADFGLTALAASLIAIVDMVLEVPILQALLRRQVFDKSHLDTGFTINLLRSLLVALVIVAAAWPFARAYADMRLVPVLAVLAIGPIARGLASPAMVTFARDLKFHQTFIVELTGKICAFGLAVALVLNGAGYWAIVANSVMAAVMGAVASYILAPYRPALSLSRFSDFSRFTGWFSSAQIVSAVNWQLDRILLGRYVDKGTFGQYVLASDLAVFPTQSVIGPAMQSVMAAFSAINADPGRMRQAFLKAVRLVMLVSVPVCLGISITSDLIVAILLGPNWHRAADLLGMISLAVLPVPYYQTLHSFCLALDRPAMLLRISMIELLLRLGLVSAGLWLFALEGVVWARLLLAAAMAVVYMLHVRHLAQIGLRQQIGNVWKVAAATALMVAAAGTLRHLLAPMALPATVELAATAATGIAVYVAGLALLGVRLARGAGRFALHDRWL